MNNNINQFLDMKKQYEAKMWDNQIAFFAVTLIFTFFPILVSRKIFIGCICIEAVMLIICSMMQSKPFGSVFCSFIHGLIWCYIFVVDGWCVIFIMKGYQKEWIISILGTVLVVLCYCGRVFLVKKRIRIGWYENKCRKGSYGSELAAAVAIITVAIMRMMARRNVFDNVEHNEICIGMSVCFFVLAVFTSMWVDAGVMYYYFKKNQLHK